MNAEVRILIIDDEAAIRNVLRLQLEGAGYRVRECATGQAGLVEITNFHPHLVILDLGLPDRDGLSVLRELRQWSRVPTIVLTVQDQQESKVQLLDAGADDYLTKPFGAKELLARIRVAIRNIGLIEATPLFVSGDLEVDVIRRRVRLADQEIKLTSTEYEVLFRLVRDAGKVVPQAQMLKQIWGDPAESNGHYLRIYINQLRKKIEKKPSSPRHILTEPGVGYRIV